MRRDGKIRDVHFISCVMSDIKCHAEYDMRPVLMKTE